MAVTTGAYIRPTYGAAWTPGSTLTDPAFAGILDLEILGGQTATGKQASFGFWPSILHAFYNWKAQSSTAPAAGSPLDMSGTRYVLFDDTPAITVTNKYLNTNVAQLCFASAHSFYVGQFVTITGVGSSFNGTFQVTAINSAIGTGFTTVFNITYSVTASNVASAASGGSVAAGAAWWNGTNNTPFSNVADTTGLNTTNLGPRRWADYVRALYSTNSATPPALLITWRSGGVDSSHNMENASSWQQNGNADEFSPSSILAGTHDNFIQAFASQLADYLFANQTQVFHIRIDQEMNGNNYGWAYNNQWVEPTNGIAPTATPDNGPALMNALVQSTSSGNPIAVSGGSAATYPGGSGMGGYGLYAAAWRHVRTLAMTTITNQLQHNHGMLAGAATTLAANVMWVWCVGSGSLITSSSNAPIPNPPFPQIPHTYGGASYTVSSVKFSGAACTVTVNPGSDYVANASSTYALVGHGIPVGASVTVTGTGSAADGTWTVTAITNTTISFASTAPVGNPAASGTVTLAPVSSYVAACASWLSFYPGDDVVDIVSVDGYNPGKTAGTWKNFYATTGSIFYSAYNALVGAVGGGKAFQISETGCVEGVAGTPTKAQWIQTNLQSGGQLLTSMPRVTSLVYFDQGGRNSGYQVRTSLSAFAAWQALGQDVNWTNNGALPSFPPITTGVPSSIIVLRNNSKANLASKTSNATAEPVYATDEHWISMGDGASPPVPASTVWLPMLPAGEITAGQVLTATGPRSATFQSPSSALGSTNGSAFLGADLGLTAAAENVLLSSSSLGLGTYYVVGQVAITSSTAGACDVYVKAGTATASIIQIPGGVAKTAAGSQGNGVVQAIITVTVAGTVSLCAFPATGAVQTAKKNPQGGSTPPGTTGATGVVWYRIA